MDYSYNYTFLKKWMVANPQYSARDIMNALETKSYTSFNRWADGITPMPVESQLRFCNYFQVPIANFYRDGEYMADCTPTLPQPDETTPEGRYIEGPKGRGEKGVNPHTTERRKSVIPVMIYGPEDEHGIRVQRETFVTSDGEIVDDGTKTQTAAPASDGAQAPSPSSLDGNAAIIIANLKAQHASEILALTNSHYERENALRSTLCSKFEEERQRTLDIIRLQAEQIREMQRSETDVLTAYAAEPSPDETRQRSENKGEKGKPKADKKG